jgi:integrase
MLKKVLDWYGGNATVPVGGENIGMNKKPTRCNCGVGSVYPRITKQGKVRWYMDYKNLQGKRVQPVIKHAQTQDEAVHALLKKIQDEYEKKYQPSKKKKGIKFDDFAEMYLEDYAKVAKDSWQTDAYRMKKVVGFFNDVELRDITPMLIQKFRAYSLKNGAGKSTVNRELTLLKTMLNLAIEEGCLEQNPAKGIKMYSEKDLLRDRVLSEEEESRLFAELADHVKPFAFTSLHTGMRKGELFYLYWCCVDFENRIIKVEKTKSKKARVIPINSALYDVLRRLEEERGDNLRVFPFKNIQTAWESARRRAGLEDLTFHDLRRTFGTRLLEAGVDIVTISKLYGHSSVLVTQRYLHPKDILSKEAVESLVKKPDNEMYLLHICDMEKDGKLANFVSSSYRMN